MKKKVLMSLVLLAIIGASAVYAQARSGGNSITGQWYVTIANQSAEIYDFRSDGALLVAGDSTGITYAISGRTITTTYSGITMGTATFAISGTGASAKLTISRASENSGLVNGTYTRSSASDTSTGSSGGNVITGKWYVKIANQSAEVYDFQSDGALLVAGDSTGITYVISGSTITTTFSGITMGTATFAIKGTGASATLTISKASKNSGLTNGTYYR